MLRERPRRYHVPPGERCARAAANAARAAGNAQRRTFFFGFAATTRFEGLGRGGLLRGDGPALREGLALEREALRSAARGSVDLAPSFVPAPSAAFDSDLPSAFASAFASALVSLLAS